MDTFNFSKFNRDFLKSPEKSFDYLFAKIDSETISFSNFFKEATKKNSLNRIITSFLKGRKTSKKFLTFLRQNHSVDFRNSIKEAKAFQSSAHYPLITELFADDPIFLRELDYWKKIWETVHNESQKAKTILAKYNFEDILILCGLYYDKLKLLHQIKRNYEASFIETVNLIINEKLKLIIENKKEIKSNYSPEEFKLRSFELLIKLIHFGDSELKNIFSAFDKKVEVDYLYGYYCYHDFQLTFFDNKTAIIKPTNEHKYLNYKKAGLRYFYWHGYYHNVVFYEFDMIYKEIENKGMSWYNQRGHIRAWEHFYQFIDAGFPEEIEVENLGKIRTHNCFQVINSIGMWTNIRWNNFLEEEILRGGNNRPYEFFLKCMQYNLEEYDNDALPVFFRNHDELMNKADEIHHLKKGEAQKAFSIFTTNLNLTNKSSIDLSDKPFIKIGSNIYWIAGITANKNYAVMLQNMLLEMDKTQTKEGIRSKYAIHVEKKLTEWFERNKFACKVNHDYYLEKQGEIDLLAFKDNTLFVCELKSTYHRATIKEVHLHFTDEHKGIKKAINQLSRDITYIKKNWGDLRELLNANCTIEELKIVPLAITTTLEPGDGQFEISGLKGYIVPLFEMNVILANTKFYLFNISELALKAKYGDQIPVKYMDVLTGIKDDPKITEEVTELVLEHFRKEIPKFNLWEKENKLCNPTDVIRVLEKGSVWDMISEKIDMNMQTLLVGDYTLNYFR